ncbi:MAG: acyltransferase family protein [Chloroflexi bacterium]|nr:acyltransferase family protein [Chloroflexota bacterium]
MFPTEDNLPKPSRARLYWVDFARILAILMVVQIHISGVLLYKWGQVPPAYWMAGNLFDAIARPSASLSFMLSGFLLLGKREHTQIFFKKRLTRVLIPFIFWSLLYWLWRSLLQGGFPEGKAFLNALLSLPVRPSSYHLWFLYPLLGLYLLTPVLRRWVSAVTDKEIWCLVIVWFLLGPVMLLVETVFDFQVAPNIEYRFSANVIFLSLGYFLLGHLFKHVKSTPRFVWAAALVFVAMLAVTVGGTYILSARAQKGEVFLYNIYMPNIVLMTMALFVLLRAFGEKFLTGVFLTGLARQVASLTFGIYLIHVMVVETLADGVWGFKASAMRLLYPRYTIPPYYSVPVVVALVFFISAALVVVWRKVPILRRLVP